MILFKKTDRAFGAQIRSVNVLPRNPAWVSDSRISRGNDLPWMMLRASEGCGGDPGMLWQLMWETHAPSGAGSAGSLVVCFWMLRLLQPKNRPSQTHAEVIL